MARPADTGKAPAAQGLRAVAGQRAARVFRYFTRHRTAANLLMVLMLLAGLAALPNMRAQFFPDVVSHSVSVSVAWPGAGAEDIDAAVVELLEPALLAVEGVSGTTALSREGRASLTAEFAPGHDMTRALDEVQMAIAAAGRLPEGAEDPQVRRSEWSDRVTDVVISGPVAVDQLARLADEYVARLFLQGATRAVIRGVAAPETVIEVNTADLIRHDLTLAQIAAAVGAAARTEPSGDLTGAAARVRAGTPQRTPDELRAVVLRQGADGATLTVGDVARVTAGGADRERAAFVGDAPAVTVRVNRSAGGDAVELQAIAASVAREMLMDAPEGVHIELVRSRAEAISGRLQLMLTNGALGLALVVALLFLFLNARTAFWVAAGIPVAIAAAIAAMYAMGLSFNMISLFALIITLGIVVDDAIVVGEHADWRARELGEAPAEAAERAATRMALPVFAASITTVIAFLGLVVIGGRFGNLIADIPLTVVAVLVASLVECFLILPHHMHKALLSAARERWYDWPSRLVNRGFRAFREGVFRPAMRLVVVARYPVLAGAVLLLALSMAAFIRGDVQWRFFAPPEQGSITGSFAMLPGASRADTLEMMRELQRAAEAVGAAFEAEHGRNPITHALAEIGGTSGPMAGGEARDPALTGSIGIELIDADERPYSSFAFTAALQEAVVPHPRLETLSFRSWAQGPGGDTLSVRLFGADTPMLKDAAEALKTALLPYPEVSGLEDTLAYDKEELSLRLTPQGQMLGFSAETLGQTLRHHLAGIEAARFPEGRHSAVIRVELAPGERAADFLDRMMLRSPQGGFVPLADIVAVESRTGFSTIRRENGLRTVSVTGDIAQDDAARATEIARDLREAILPRIAEEHGVNWQLSGQAEQESAFLSEALLGLMLCLAGIYLTLAWAFSSWTRPLIVMAVIPFGLIGAIWGHWHWQVPLSMFSVVGLVGMTGIIVNDSIVLLKTVEEHEAERGLFPAIVAAACNRLRPVLLTTLTTVLGLAPLLFEQSVQAQFLKPTVITLVYGLGFGMVLVLLVVPAILAIQFDLRRLRQSLARAGGRRNRAAPLAWMVRLAAGLLAVAFASTLGHVGLRGTWPGPLVQLAPWLPDAGPAAALILFLAAAAILLAILWLAGVAAFALARHRAARRRLLHGESARPGRAKVV